MLGFATCALNCLEVIVQFLNVPREFFLPGAPRNPDERLAVNFTDGLLFGGHRRRKILAFALKGGNHSRPFDAKAIIYKYLTECARRCERQNSSRWKKKGSCRSRCSNCSVESARSVTWPTLRPGRTALP